MAFIELKNYEISHPSLKKRIPRFDFSLFPGEAVSVCTDNEDDAHVFFRALATLTPPAGGDYFFRGKKLEFTSYKHLLPFKKKIAYITSDAALISNRTILENLIMMRAYFENRLNLRLDEHTLAYCKLFNIQDKLKLRPADLNPTDLQIAIMIRELAKSPEMILLERPEDFIGHSHIPIFGELIHKMIGSGIPLVFFSFNDTFVNQFSEFVRFHFI